MQSGVLEAPRDPARRFFSFSPRWTREPLLHFVVLGAVLFGADHYIVSHEGDPRTIVIDATVDAQAREVFTKARGRVPNADELYALRKVWLDNEVLYREGLTMQLDKGDQAIRERVIFKALSVIDASVKRPAFDDDTLRRWFQAHHGRYDQPARYDFQEAVLSGDKSESALHAFAANLNAGTPGEAQAALRVFKDRPRDNLVQSYGQEFVDALEGTPVNEWRVLPTRNGPRAMRLETVKAAVPAKFEDLRGVILQDWTDSVMAEQRSAAVRALTKKYTIRTVDGAK